MKEYDVVVVGAGWAGLSVSYAIKQLGLRHLVLERGRIGETWRTQRWNSFHMNTPNALTVLPGSRYDGVEPEGFMSCDAFLSMLERYAAENALPLREQTAVEAAFRSGSGFELQTSDDPIRARSLVVASGNLNVPRRPEFASKLPRSIQQLHGAEYRSPDALPAGAVLVVGCGDTGGQIAEELVHAGRKVYLSTGRNGRIPRRYRGRDIFLWMSDSKLNRNPRPPGMAGRALVGRTGTTSLQSLSALGVVLAGRVSDVSQTGIVRFDDSLLESIGYADEFSADLKARIDAYIDKERLTAPAAELDPAEIVVPRLQNPPVRELDLGKAGVRTVIWATGYRGNFDWLKVSGAVDAGGNPLQEKSASVPGIYFAGLDSKEMQRSGTVLAAAFEAERIATYLMADRSVVP